MLSYNNFGLWYVHPVSYKHDRYGSLWYNDHSQNTLFHSLLQDIGWKRKRATSPYFCINILMTHQNHPLLEKVPKFWILQLFFWSFAFFRNKKFGFHSTWSPYHRHLRFACCLHLSWRYIWIRLQLRPQLIHSKLDKCDVSLQRAHDASMHPRSVVWFTFFSGESPSGLRQARGDKTWT